VAFSSDGRRVPSASRDRTVKIWDAQSGACVQTFEGHSDSVTSAAFSSDGRRVASASHDKTVMIWDAQSGACVQTFGVNRTVFDLSFHPTNSSLYTEVGVIALNEPTTSNTTPVTSFSRERQDPQDLQEPQYRSCGVSSDRLWITWNSQNWLWLPPEYRPGCSAVAPSGLAVALGCRSGRVLVFGFCTAAISKYVQHSSHLSVT
jgi:hypothetical protein